MKRLAAALLAVLSVGFAAPAQASPASYLDDLSSSPWGFYGDIETWLAIGYAVCHRIEMGYNQTDLVNFVVRNTGQGVYGPQAAYVVESTSVEQEDAPHETSPAAQRPVSADALWRLHLDQGQRRHFGTDPQRG